MLALLCHTICTSILGGAPYWEARPIGRRALLAQAYQENSISENKCAFDEHCMPQNNSFPIYRLTVECR